MTTVRQARTGTIKIKVEASKLAAIKNTKDYSNLETGLEFVDTPSPRLNLSTSEDVRREMAKVYRETRSRLIEPSEATKLVFILGQILRAHESFVLETRIAELEQRGLG